MLEDEELVAPVRAAFAREGVLVHEHARVLRLEPRENGVSAFIARAKADGTAEKEEIEGSHVLIAAGGAPHVEGLGLAAARVRYTAAGVEVNANLRTRNRRVYALGAVANSARSAAAGEHHAEIVLDQLLRPRFGLPPLLPPRHAGAAVIFTDPEIAVAGLSEGDAREQGRRIRVLRWPFSETDRGQIAGAPQGHVKLITSPGGKILGGGIVGPEAGELINLVTLAISKGLTAADLASAMVAYPALAEAVRRAAATGGGRGGNVATRFVQRFFNWFQ